jgi:hypothetical protein
VRLLGVRVAGLVHGAPEPSRDDAPPQMALPL